MTREIKFRGKRLDNGEWVYGYLCENTNGKNCIQEIIGKVVDGFAVPGRLHPVNPDTISQYTEVRDNQTQMREVYEHDLYEVNGVLCEVVYNQQIASFVLLEIITQQIGTRPIGEMFDMFPSVHIGNIYDNPELLED